MSYKIGEFQNDNMVRRLRIWAWTLIALADLAIICLVIYSEYFMGRQ